MIHLFVNLGELFANLGELFVNLSELFANLCRFLANCEFFAESLDELLDERNWGRVIVRVKVRVQRLV